MSLETRIMADLKEAMKNKDEAAKRSIRAIKAAILLQKTDGSGQALDEAGEIKLLQKLVKQRSDSLEIYEKQGREDLATPEREEIAVIEKYLPKQMDEAELEAVLKELFFSVKKVDRIFHGLTTVPPENFNYHRLFFDCVKYLSSDSLINDSYEKHMKLLTEKIKQAQEKKQISSELDPKALAFNIIGTLEGTYLMSLYLPSLDVDAVVTKMFLNLQKLLFL